MDPLEIPIETSGDITMTRSVLAESNNDSRILAAQIHDRGKKLGVQTRVWMDPDEVAVRIKWEPDNG